MSLRSLTLLLLTAPAAFPQGPSIPELASACDTATFANRPWTTYQIGSLLEVTAPYGLKRDSSVQAALLFHHGGARWRGASVILEWDVSNRAYAGALHDSLEARLARHAPMPQDSFPPGPTGWVFRYVADTTDTPLAITLWAMPPPPHDIIYIVTIGACTSGGIEIARRIARSVRVRE